MLGSTFASGRLRTRRLATALVTGLAVVGLGIAGPAGVRQAEAGGGAAPELRFQDGIQGISRDTKLSKFKGRPLLLVFWIPICPHCPPAAANADRLYRKYHARGLEVVGVTHGRKGYVSQYMNNNRYGWGIGFDWAGATFQAYGVSGLPGVVLVGKNGTRVWDTANLDAAIERELASK